MGCCHSLGDGPRRQVQLPTEVNPAFVLVNPLATRDASASSIRGTGLTTPGASPAADTASPFELGDGAFVRSHEADALRFSFFQPAGEPSTDPGLPVPGAAMQQDRLRYARSL